MDAGQWLIGSLLLAVPLTAGGKRAMRDFNNWLQDRVARHRYQPPVVPDAPRSLALNAYASHVTKTPLAVYDHEQEQP